MNNQFGRTVYVLGLSLRGTKSLESWKTFILDLCRNLTMTPVYSPAVYSYPVDDKGGVGLTIVQPITDSFVAVDTWPEHDGAYLHICSCKPFDQAKLTHLVNEEFVVLDTMSGDLRL